MTSADVFQISILSEKKCALQILQWPHRSYSKEIMLLCTYPYMSWGRAPRFSQVIDEDWPKSEHHMLCPRSSEEDKAAVLPPLMLHCFCKAVRPVSGCYSNVFAQFSQSLLYNSAFISPLSWSVHCLGQPIKCSLFEHWQFNYYPFHLPLLVTSSHYF